MAFRTFEYVKRFTTPEALTNVMAMFASVAASTIAREALHRLAPRGHMLQTRNRSIGRITEVVKAF